MTRAHGKPGMIHDRRFAAVAVWGTLALMLLGSPNRLSGGDWPQILGPHRNGQADKEQLARDWPAGGPRVVWRVRVGQGYAGAAVADNRVVLFHRVKDEAVCDAIDVHTGKILSRATRATHYQSGIAPDDGPRCVPLIHQGRVYLHDADGALHCVAPADGEVVWSRDAAHDFKAPAGYFGAGSTPLVDGDRLLVNVGGPGAGIVAFSLADGKTLWQSTDDAASYSSPILATIRGTRQAIFVTRLNVVSVDPKTGAELFRFPFGMRGPTVNAATPRVMGDELFVSASYGIGAQLMEIRESGPKTVWARDDVMSSQYTTCVEHQGVFYGIDGRQDQGVARLRAFDPHTGKVFWTQEGFGTGNLLLADDKLLIMKTDGELVLAEPSPEAFRPLAKAKIFEDVVQSLPALANGRLYVRDSKALMCLDVGR